MAVNPQKILSTSESPVATTDSRPVPDPTVLTTQQLVTSISWLQSLVEEKFAGVNTRLEGIVAVANERLVRIDQQFLERDKAVTSALAAQKEAAAETRRSSEQAISKAESATAESIKQLQALFQSTIAGITTQVQDIKSRLDKGEGGQAGQIVARTDVRNESNDNRGYVFGLFGIIGVIVSIGALVLAVLAHTK